jgi:hypothetical protein
VSDGSGRDSVVLGKDLVGDPWISSWYLRSFLDVFVDHV